MLCLFLAKHLLTPLQVFKNRDIYFYYQGRSIFLIEMGLVILITLFRWLYVHASLDFLLLQNIFGPGQQPKPNKHFVN